MTTAMNPQAWVLGLILAQSVHRPTSYFTDYALLTYAFQAYKKQMNILMLFNKGVLQN